MFERDLLVIFCCPEQIQESKHFLGPYPGKDIHTPGISHDKRPFYFHIILFNRLDGIRMRYYSIINHSQCGSLLDLLCITKFGDDLYSRTFIGRSRWMKISR